MNWYERKGLFLVRAQILWLRRGDVVTLELAEPDRCPEWEKVAIGLHHTKWLLTERLVGDEDPSVPRWICTFERVGHAEKLLTVSSDQVLEDGRFIGFLELKHQRGLLSAEWFGITKPKYIAQRCPAVAPTLSMDEVDAAWETCARIKKERLDRQERRAKRSEERKEAKAFWSAIKRGEEIVVPDDDNTLRLERLYSKFFDRGNRVARSTKKSSPEKILTIRRKRFGGGK